MEDSLTQAAEDIVSAFTTPEKPGSVSLEAGDLARNDLLKLATLLGKTEIT